MKHQNRGAKRWREKKEKISLYSDVTLVRMWETIDAICQTHNWAFTENCKVQKGKKEKKIYKILNTLIEKQQHIHTTNDIHK